VRDAYTIFRKELMEVLGDRHSFRGAFLQAAITIVLTGIVVPFMDAGVWTKVTTAMMLYVVFPSTLAATLAADAFSGESERRTIETLLATPLADSSIFLGKTAAAVAFVFFISTVSLCTGYAVAALRGLLPEHLPAALFGGVLGGALAGGFLVAALAATISVRVPVARSAQQMASLLTFALAGLSVTALRRLGGPLNWSAILPADVVIFVAGLAGLALGTTLFRRDRFFEER
jgi:ABC-type transport system involved in multi-copper enzyme maturation permease subunit